MSEPTEQDIAAEAAVARVIARVNALCDRYSRDYVVVEPDGNGIGLFGDIVRAALAPTEPQETT